MLTFDKSNSFNFFQDLTPEVRNRIADMGKVKKVRKGEMLFKQDSYADFIYMIKEGKISLTMQFRVELMDKLPSLGKGEIIGWSALVPPHIYTMGAQAEEESIVIGFEGVKMLEIMEEDKETGYHILRNLSEVIGSRLVSVSTQLMSLRV
jgi:CRP-like cAMP-binding protein